VRWDDSARTYAMEIAVPVPADDGRPGGVLKAVADIREMLASVAGIELGGGHRRVCVSPHRRRLAAGARARRPRYCDSREAGDQRH